MGILEWLKLGSDLRQMQDWISSNVIAAEPISGGLQVNISYLGIAFIVWFIHWRRKVTQKKLAKAQAKG